MTYQKPPGLTADEQTHEKEVREDATKAKRAKAAKAEDLRMEQWHDSYSALGG